MGKRKCFKPRMLAEGVMKKGRERGCRRGTAKLDGSEAVHRDKEIKRKHKGHAQWDQEKTEVNEGTLNGSVPHGLPGQSLFAPCVDIWNTPRSMPLSSQPLLLIF